MKKTIIQQILDHIFGHKYYAVISNRVGTFQVGLHENICATKAEAKQLLMGVASFQQVEIISFRSRNNYIRQTDEKGFVTYTLGED